MSLVKILYKRKDSEKINGVVVKETQARDILSHTNINIMLILPVKEGENVKRDYILL